MPSSWKRGCLLGSLFVSLACSGAEGGPRGASDAGLRLTLRVPELPPVPELQDWSDNPASEAARELGRAIFHDARLSGSGRTSCNTCHTDFINFQDALNQSIPDRSSPDDRPLLPRHTPSLLNLVYAPVFRWDGSHDDLVEVLAFPFAEANMNLSVGIPKDDPQSTDIPTARTTLQARLSVEIPGYVKLYQDAFAVDITTASKKELWALTGKALAVFLRGAVSKDAPFDRWNTGDDDAMSAAAVRGLELFRGKGKCTACHAGPFLTDFAYHNVSSELPNADGERDDEGRFSVTGADEDRGKFLTPGLRSVYATPPYFHDGTMGGLQRLIEHLTSGDATRDPNHDPLLDAIEPFSAKETTDMVEFLRALSGEPVTTLGRPEALP